jgi:hypothetical protein
MKKIKLTILSLAVVFSISAAFATKPHWNCTDYVQYYYNGSGYTQVSALYGCTQNPLNTCTYYTINGINYTPCLSGTYVACMGCAVENPHAKTK